MKAKNSDFIYKIFFIVVGVILAGLLIAWLVGTYKDKKKEADAGTQKINSVTSSMADFDLTVYDGASIKGESLLDLITELKKKEVQLSVEVITLENEAKCYNYEMDANKENLGNPISITPTPKKAAKDYITPTGNFKGEIVRNKNNEITCLRFAQQK